MDDTPTVVLVPQPARDVSAREHARAVADARPPPGIVVLPSLRDRVRAATRPELLLLWALLTWYITVVTPYLPSTPSHVWTNALMFCLAVGTGMNMNAFSGQQGVALSEWLLRNPSLVLRFYATPFAVSSYSGVAADDPSRFAAIFPRDAARLVPACLLSAGVPMCLAALHAWLPSPAGAAQKPAETTKLLDTGAAVAPPQPPPR